MRKAVVGIFIFFLIALPAFAQTKLYDEPPTSVLNKEGAQGVLNLVNDIGLWLFGILSAVAVIFIILSAYGFLTSGGDETKLKKAKSQLLYAIIAFVVGLLSWSLILLVSGFFDEEPNGNNVTPPPIYGNV